MSTLVTAKGPNIYKLDIYGDWLIEMICKPDAPASRRWLSHAYNIGGSKAYINGVSYPDEPCARICMRATADAVDKAVLAGERVDHYIGNVQVNLLWQLNEALGVQDPAVKPIIFCGMEPENWRPMDEYGSPRLRSYQQFMRDFQLPLPLLLDRSSSTLNAEPRTHYIHYISTVHTQTRLPKRVRIRRHPLISSSALPIQRSWLRRGGKWDWAGRSTNQAEGPGKLIFIRSASLRRQQASKVTLVNWRDIQC